MVICGIIHRFGRLSVANIGDKDDNETIFGADKWSSGLNSYIDTCMHMIITTNWSLEGFGGVFSQGRMQSSASNGYSFVVSHKDSEDGNRYCEGQESDPSGRYIRVSTTKINHG